MVIKYSTTANQLSTEQKKISLIWLFIQTDFPEHSQNKMPDNQTVSHSQSLIRRIIFISLALVQSKIE